MLDSTSRHLSLRFLWFTNLPYFIWKWCDFWPRQPEWPPSGESAAFQVWVQDGILGRGNWIGLQPGNLLPFKFETKMRFWSKATGSASIRHICCLWHIRARLGFQQRQLDRPPSGIFAAFGTFEQVWVFSKGNQIGLRPAYLLPLTHSIKIGSSAEATKMAPDRQNCCLWLLSKIKWSTPRHFTWFLLRGN